MKTALVTALALGFAFASSARAHTIGDEAHDHATPKYDFSVKPPMGVVLRNHDALGHASLLPRPATKERGEGRGEGFPDLLSDAPPLPIPLLHSMAEREWRPVVLVAAANSPTLPANRVPAARVASIFAPFAPKVKTRSDANFLYVESDGLPAHNMMVGIRNWQQQVPLPHDYSGDRAWRLPLHPVPSKNPVSIQGRFLRGAIALAANGIPIFNPQNNRGEVSQEIGELDEWGGHCGRADDYHYHAAPLHLQSVLGKNLPIAYALDGYPIYGLTEPDGATPTKLDAFNGHETTALGYHYHGSLKYPYVNGGFHGEVVEAGGQVDPQPSAGGWRGAGAPLRGAVITGFTSRDKSHSLKYELAGETCFVNYTLLDNGSVKFDYVDGRGQVRTETYSQQPRGPGGDPKGKGGQKKGDPKGKGGSRPGL